MRALALRRGPLALAQPLVRVRLRRGLRLELRLELLDSCLAFFLLSPYLREAAPREIVLAACQLGEAIRPHLR